MRYTLYTLIAVAVFILMPFNQVVSAEMVDETRTLHIESASNIQYSSSLNILNNTTNNRFTNAELLIPEFTSKVGFDGGFSGSFLPPAKFQTNFGRDSDKNNKLVLANTIEFQEKNLLSGSSESWWRCPYAWNWSISDQRDWGVRLSIYMIDDPRNVNLTFPSSSTNSGAVPNAESYSSLVYRRDFSDCGIISDNNQTWTHHEVNIPVNDEWNISKANLLTDSERHWLENTSEERRVRDANGDNTTSSSWNGDFENYNKIHYSFGWFNVSAPIYPNETYFVVWEISDSDLGQNDGCSLWVTASDLGRNSYYRSLIAWDDSGSSFNGTVYEIPIDLDTSVIFRIGLGDGVTGIKLDYNDNSNHQTHTNDILTDPSFEVGDGNTNNLFYNMGTGEGWTTGTVNKNTYEGWVKITNSGDGLAEIYQNITNDWADGEDGLDRDLSVCSYGYIKSTLGGTRLNKGADVRIKMSFGDLNDTYVSQVGTVFRNSAFGINFNNDRLGADALNYSIIIARTGVVLDTDGLAHYGNYIYCADSDTTSTLVSNTNDVIPKDCYLTFNFYGNDADSSGSCAIKIYNQNDPFNPTWSVIVSTPRKETVSPPVFRIMGGFSSWITMLPLASADPVYLFPEEPRITVEKIAVVERYVETDWTISDTDYLVNTAYPERAFEITTPQYDESYPNINVLEIVDKKSSTISHNVQIEQEQYEVVSGSRRFYATTYYQLREDWLSYGLPTLYYEFSVSDDNGATWDSTVAVGNVVDSSWHQLTTGFIDMTNANRFKVRCIIEFPAKSLVHILWGASSMAYLDNFTIQSIALSNDISKYEFYQEVDHRGFNSTNYYSLMIPFRHLSDPDFSPLAEITWYDDSDAQVGSIVETNSGDWYDDFILRSIKTTTIPSDAEYCKIELTNYGQDSYLFLNDRNNDGYRNTRDDYKYNYLRNFNENNPSHTNLETFFSPYYSLKLTEGQWINADGSFNTVYFYFVVVRFVEFNDADPEILEVKFFDVEVGDLTAFRVELSDFGAVYDDQEWLAYLDVKARAGETITDQIWDALANFWEWLVNSPLGQWLANTIGKFIYDVLEFLVPALEWAIDMIIQVTIILIAIGIFFITTLMFWKLVNFFILVSDGRTSEGIELLNATTTSIISTASSIKSGIGKVGSGLVGVFK